MVCDLADLCGGVATPALWAILGAHEPMKSAAKECSFVSRKVTVRIPKGEGSYPRWGQLGTASLPESAGTCQSCSSWVQAQKVEKRAVLTGWAHFSQWRERRGSNPHPNPLFPAFLATPIFWGRIGDRFAPLSFAGLWKATEFQTLYRAPSPGGKKALGRTAGLSDLSTPPPSRCLDQECHSTTLKDIFLSRTVTNYPLGSIL